LSTFPNWIGGARTRKELTLIVDGDRMTENFQRPEGTKVRIIRTRPMTDHPPFTLDKPVIRLAVHGRPRAYTAFFIT
jgi:hypothetical protein